MPDRAALLDAVDAGAVTDEELAAVAGSSIATMGMALSGDVERQLRAIRNRTTSMGVNECVVNEGMPYFNAWVNAEGNRADLDKDGTLAGYTMDSWGGTVGFDVDFDPYFTAGMAITAMYGNLTANGPETKAEGENSPKHKRNRRRRGSKKSERETIPTTFETTSKPKGEVIPEAELKMELREVSEGEDMPFDFISQLIRDIGLNAYAELYSCEDGTRRIAIKGDDASVLIGHHGDTLDALQYLANLASARKNANGERDKSRVTIDIEGYRAKREDTLRALARRMAAKALRNKRSVMLEPMSAYERRIIHSEIQGIEGVSTNSIGSDNNRKIVIYLVDKKPEEIFEEEEMEETVDTAEVIEETSSEE
jgi:spoIIIJ-associated protein